MAVAGTVRIPAGFSQLDPNRRRTSRAKSGRWRKNTINLICLNITTNGLIAPLTHDVHVKTSFLN